MISIKTLEKLEPDNLVMLGDGESHTIHGGGPISGLAAAFGTTLGIGINGLVTGQSSGSILQQQVAFGVPAFIGGALVPGP